MKRIYLVAAALLLSSCSYYGGATNSNPSPVEAPQVVVAPTAECHYRKTAEGQYLPDAHCTPGAAAKLVTQQNIQETICKPGYSQSVRPDSSFTSQWKRTQLGLGWYGVVDADPSKFEEDHLVSLELGGDPRSLDNLWPEELASARVKDRVENAAHAAVCGGRMFLADAQRGIALDWTVLGRQLGVLQ